jgi:hypothetical protein
MLYHWQGGSMKRYLVLSILLSVAVVVTGCGGGGGKGRKNPEQNTEPAVTNPTNDSKIIFEDDFETDLGWTTTGFWHRQKNDLTIYNKAVPDYVTLPVGDTSNGRIPMAFQGEYCYWYGEAATGNYLGVQQADDKKLSGGTSVETNEGSLTSPLINIPQNSNPVLTFMTWYEIEGFDPCYIGYDLMKVEVLKEGSDVAETLCFLNPEENPNYSDDADPSLAYTSGGYNLPGKWIEVKRSLNDYRGQAVRIRFTFLTDSIQYNGFRGWFIDQVKVIDSDGPVITIQGMRMRYLPGNLTKRRPRK